MKKLIVLLATFALLGAIAQAADDYVAEELLISFKPGTRGAQADSIRNGLGAKKIKGWAEINAEHWRLPHGLEVPKAIEALSRNPNVEYAEPNYLLRADAVPRDARRAELWPLHNLGLSGGTPDADIDAPEAWEVRHDASSVVVAVIDSGIDYNHPDLAANIFINPGESGTDSQGRNMATNGVDDDGNGYVDDVRGWDFINNDNQPLDENGHGTHVAGTIGAVGDNEIGVAGVAWKVQLMPLKMLDANAVGPLSAGVSALLYAAKFVDGSGNKIVRISNNSYGSGSTKSKAMESAIKSFAGLFVASAGNSAITTVQFPAGFPLPNIVAVAATDRNDLLAWFSNYGAAWVHIAAPGSGILSTVPGAGYDYYSGTSMAAPHVSGVAALLLAQNPVWAATELKAQMLNTVDLLSPLAGKVSSGGRLNAGRALGASEFPDDTTPPAAITDLAVASSQLTSITLAWSAPGIPDVDAATYFYDLRYSTFPITEQNFPSAFPIAMAPKAPGAPETFTVGGLSIARTYYFAIKSYDLAGNPSPISNIPSGATLDNDWRFLTVLSGNSVANTVGAARNESGGWTFVSDADGNLKFLNYIAGDGFYFQETVAPISGGASVVYDSLWTPTITYISAGKLFFAQKISGGWAPSTVESRDILNGDTTSAYDSTGAFWTAYPKGGRSAGLYAARKVGATWTTFLVERNGDGNYNQLAIAPDGRPSIAYADDTTGDGKADVLKLAHFNGTSWAISTVDNVASGPVSLAYTPDGSAAIASRSGSNNQLRFYLSNGSGWFSEVIDPTVTIQSCSIAGHSDGTIWIAYATLTDMRAAKRDPATGQWTTMLIDPDGPGTCRTAMFIGPASGRPLVLYGGPSDVGGVTDGLRYAVKNTP